MLGERGGGERERGTDRQKQEGRKGGLETENVVGITADVCKILRTGPGTRQHLVTIADWSMPLTWDTCSQMGSRICWILER